jgi:hypothetical protein
MKKFLLGCVAMLGMSLSNVASAGQIDHVQWTANSFAGKKNGTDTQPFFGGTVTATMSSYNGDNSTQGGGSSVNDASYPDSYKEPNGSSSWIGMYRSGAAYTGKLTYTFSGGIPSGTRFVVGDLEGLSAGANRISSVTVIAYSGGTGGTVVDPAWQAVYYMPSPTSGNVPLSPDEGTTPGTWFDSTVDTLYANSGIKPDAVNYDSLWHLQFNGDVVADTVEFIVSARTDDGLVFGLLQPVPEPTSMAIFGLAAGAAGFRSLRRRKNS